MNSIRGNILANILCTIWLSGLVFFLTPYYKALLGDGGFALVGVFMTLQLLCAPLDAGLRGTVGRELAHLKVQPGKEGDMWNLVLTFERIYLGMTVSLFLLVALASPAVSHYWLSSLEFSPPIVTLTVVCMGFALAAQWPFFLYASALTGLEKQKSLAVLNIIIYAVRYLGAFLVLRHISATAMAFLLWQGGVCLAHSFFARVLLWRSLSPRSASARTEWAILRRHRNFTLGMGTLIVMNVLILQMDRIFLSNTRLCSPEVFSRYTLAFVAATLMLRIVEPISQAVFPRFTSLVAMGDISTLASLYHRSCQSVTVLVGVPAIVLCFFAPQFLWLWTGQIDEARQVAPLLRGLLLATYLWSLSRLPARMQMAHKSTRLLVAYSTTTLLVMIPTMWWMILRYQAVGAVLCLLLFHGLRLIVFLPIMHRRILPRDLWRWYFQDLLLPGLAITGVCAGVWRIAPSEAGRGVTLFWIGSAAFLSLVVGTILSPALREQLLLAIGFDASRNSKPKDAAPQD